MSTTTVVGLVRDCIMAAFGVAILFGADFTDEQIAGVVLLFSTAIALGTWLLEHRPWRRQP